MPAATAIWSPPLHGKPCPTTSSLATLLCFTGTLHFPSCPEACPACSGFDEIGHGPRRLCWCFWRPGCQGRGSRSSHYPERFEVLVRFVRFVLWHLDEGLNNFQSARVTEIGQTLLEIVDWMSSMYKFDRLDRSPTTSSSSF